MRLFSALCLPPEATERLSRLQLRLATPKDGLRWTPPTQWHLTLGFYGDCEPAQCDALELQLRQGLLPAATLILQQLGCFPLKGILFAEIAPEPSLLQLQTAVTAAATAAGLGQESRPFHPHITLARSRGGKAGAQAVAQWRTAGLPPFGPALRWGATELILMESTLLRAGNVFNTLARIPLSASAANQQSPALS